MRLVLILALLGSPAMAAPMVPHLPGLPIIEPATPAPEPCAETVCPRDT
ncbi:MAG: hypothetical protein AAF919_17015 [Pseudomonadota bacterium]